MARFPLTYVATGLVSQTERVVPGATVSFYEVDGITPLGQTLWNQPTGGTGQANPTTTGANGATPTFWLDNAQAIVVSWVAPGWAGVTETLSVGGGTSSGTPTGSAGGDLTGTFPNPTVTNNAITSAKIASGAVSATKLAAGAATGAALGSDVATLTTGKVPTSELGTGTANSGTFLRGDQTWTTPSTPPSGTAGGALSGSYPSPSLASGAATGAALGADVATRVSGLVPTSQLGAGTPSSSTYLRGDQTWATGTSGALAGLSDVSGSFVSGSGIRYGASGFKPNGLRFSAVAYGVEATGTDSATTATANGTALDAAIAAAHSAGDGSIVELDWTGTAQFPGGHAVWKRLHYCGTGFNVMKLKNSATAGTNLLQTADFATITQTIPGSPYTVGQYEFSVTDIVLDGNKANNASGGSGLAIAGYGYHLDNLYIQNCKQAGWWSEWNTAAEPIGTGGSNHERAFHVGRVVLINNDCASVPAANTRSAQSRSAVPTGQATIFGPGDSWIQYIEAYKDGSVAGIGVNQGQLDFNAGSFSAFDLTINNCTVWLNHATAVDLSGENCIIHYIHAEGANTNLRINSNGVRIYGGKVFGPQASGKNIDIASAFNFGYLCCNVASIGTSGITYLNNSGSCADATIILTMDNGYALPLTLSSGSFPSSAKHVSLTFDNWGGGTVTAGWIPQLVGSTSIWALFRANMPVSGHFFSKAGAPANTDTGLTGNGMWALYKDTSGGSLYLAGNDGGTIKKVALT